MTYFYVFLFLEILTIFFLTFYPGKTLGNTYIFIRKYQNFRKYLEILGNTGNTRKYKTKNMNY
jgi:hypothetical protein